MKPHQFSRVLLHTRYELDRFEKTLLRLEAFDYPSNVAQLLIDSQKQESEKARKSLDAVADDFGDDPTGAAARLVSEYRKIMQRRRYLEVLEKARSDEVPWSLVPSVEHIAKSLLGSRPVLVTTTPEMNYMVWWSLDGSQPVTVYLPKLHRANGFLHVLIGHELFHPIVVDFFDSEKAIIKPKLLKVCQDLLGKVDDDQPDLFSQPRLDALLAYAFEQWERGLTELMCDMGAAAVFGPAALWTVSGFAATQNLNAPPTHDNQFYPPWRMRISCMHDYINKMDSGERRIDELCEALREVGLDKHSDVIKRSLAQDSDPYNVDQISEHPLRVLTLKVYAHVSESMERAQQFVQIAAEKLPDRWTGTWQQVPELLPRLALLVPPSELILAGKRESGPASISAIVLACWIERLFQEGENALGLKEYRRLCRLMLKAIEDAELKREFADWVSS